MASLLFSSFLMQMLLHMVMLICKSTKSHLPGGEKKGEVI